MLPFFSASSLQGENHSDEARFWKTLSLPLPDFPSVPMNPQQKLQQLQQSIIHEPMLSQEKRMGTDLTKPIQQELRVYTRRNQPQGNKYSAESQHCHEPNPVVYESINNSGNSNSSSSHDHDNLELPIALRKGTRTCTLHPISNFVTYKKLSPSFRAFTTKMSSVEIPRSIQEALADRDWRKTVI
ncbi:hypothetical protein Pfo_006766, partial [Paulownia fortunei]